MQRTYRVSILIPHYKGKECLRILLPSVANQTFHDYEVMIIDDCTPDRSAVEYIKGLIKDHDNMRLVENTENMRFVRTVNKGIRLARGEYICLLNQDTEVKNIFVERNVEIMDDDPSIGALSCIIVDQHGDNWFSGGAFKRGLPVNLEDDFSGIRPADFIAGTAAFYRREVFDSIGLFDESLRMYHEDVEFGMRLRAETDLRACVFSEKLVTHYLEPRMPTTEFFYLLRRNEILILRRYYRRYIPEAMASHFGKGTRLLASWARKMIVSILSLKPQRHRTLLGVALGTFAGSVVGLFKRQGKITFPTSGVR